MTLDIDEIVRKGDQFRRRLGKLKRQLDPVRFPWYPYDSLANLLPLKDLLRAEYRLLFDTVRDYPVLDVGCGDGALAFFLESFGLAVHAIDNPATSANAMQGIALLKTASRSSVEIIELDLDADFSLPSRHYGLILFLGTLYHLKNPFHVLETLAQYGHYCIISTRVARFSPCRQVKLQEVPVAYLLDRCECNDDPTNYWIFSDAGLRRILERTGWEIYSYLTTGNMSDSDPISSRADERAFCLVKSRVAQPYLGGQLISGWHSVEDGYWRWTERKFSVQFRCSALQEEPVVKLKFTLPEAVLHRLGSLTLSVQVNGVALRPQEYTYPGEHAYIRSVPAEALRSDIVIVEFQLDKALPPDEIDSRERGVAVSLIDLERIMK